ncbi:hypothetical protein VKT23_009729 [Stygiomarasmius scandens]|uniref:Heterokaryon incompatibility domain-containing protein n=1 Tax=Marasmiellus scandens TaxID=2682957 RepID=A0ABR1JIG7_9AGAR
MRLLHTEDFTLTEFHANIPIYAILSHTWLEKEDEINFQDIRNLDDARKREKATSWSKVAKACEYARKHSFKWIWIDSCCINKESSAELSEAINSMYQYYLDAAVCYVYLSDVGEEDPVEPKSAFRRSRWFTRGWTLQELLAPVYSVFLSKNWLEIGTKWSLRNTISAITSIPCSVFEGEDLYDYSIAQRMSWAAQRQTTRPEDQAYCLMGIFGISMSTIYGEGGAKAFMRLQQEIIKISDDRSIFAWIAPDGEKESRGLFAKSPYEFRASGDVRALTRPESYLEPDKSSFSFNNNGLRIYLPLLTAKSSSEGPLFLAPLLCRSENDGKFLSIYLRNADGTYIRHRPSEVLLESTLCQANVQEVVIKENQLIPRARSQQHHYLALSKPVVHGDCAHCGKGHYYDEYFSVDNFIYETLQGDRFSVAISGEKFAIISDTTSPPISKVMGNTKALSENSVQWNHHQDRIYTPLKSGGLICLSLHINGLHSELHLEYLLKADPRIPTFTKQLRAPSKLSFGVNSLAPQLQPDVYPPDYFISQREGKMYVYIPNYTDKAKSICILTMNWGRLCIFIALEFRLSRYQSEPWKDISVYHLDNGNPPNAKEIWSSYFDGGSRARTRFRQNSNQFTYRWGDTFYTFTVDAGQREILQHGTHFVCIDVDGGVKVSAPRAGLI